MKAVRVRLSRLLFEGIAHAGLGWHRGSRVRSGLRSKRSRSAPRAKFRRRFESPLKITLFDQISLKSPITTSGIMI